MTTEWPPGMFKKSSQQGRSHFDARSVHAVREHSKMARRPLAGFFNILILQCLSLVTQVIKKSGESVPRFPAQEHGMS